MRWEHFALSVMATALLTGAAAWLSFGPSTASSAEVRRIADALAKQEVTDATLSGRIVALESAVIEIKEQNRDFLNELRRIMREGR